MLKRLYLAIMLSLSLFACKSVYEKQGDKHLSENDGLSALARYQIVQKKNKGSRDFPKNLAKAYILSMGTTSDILGDPEIILTYREKIFELFPTIASQVLENLYIETAARAAAKMVSVPDPRFRDLCRTFIKDTQKLGASGMVARQMAMVAQELEQREEQIYQKLLAAQQ